jgi:arginyl-tRNA synthetase
MKSEILALLTEALDKVAEQQGVSERPGIHLEPCKNPQHGDYASNIAMVMAKPLRQAPRKLAADLLAALPDSPLIAAAEIAGPGFINLRLADDAYWRNLEQICEQGPDYGRNSSEQPRSIQVEFVSANPTGPLHVGHGRGAAYGAVVADLLEAVGHRVHREYYVNDAGRQMDILATSTWLRYLELCGEELTFPGNGYRGDYVWDIAAGIHREHGDHYREAAEQVFAGVPPDASYDAEGRLVAGDKEAHIDALIARARELLGDNRYRFVFEIALNTILDDIRDDLGRFGVTYQQWFSEYSLVDKGLVNQVLDRLRAGGHLYQDKGATWFRSTDFGDEKDRVVIRENGQATYFASDIAYHYDKFQRGFDQVIDIWGADHHGYVPRVKAALQALGCDPHRLQVLLVQFAILYRDGERVQMSTRSGEFVTLRQLRKEVGKDAARFFYVLRRCEQHLDFDLDLARSQSNDNPVYYLQYAHARIHSVLGQAGEQFPGQQDGPVNHALLTEPDERELLKTLALYPQTLAHAAENMEPHLLGHYLRELANQFHGYYSRHTFLVPDGELRKARLRLVLAIRQILRNGLNLLGVSAPEQM